MANLPETSNFDTGVYQLETADPVQGGASGLSNTPFKNLVNRTRWLYDQVQAILTAIGTLAGLNSPALTGTPTAPTPAAGDNSTKIATTAFVDTAIFGLVTKSVAGNSNVTLVAAEYGVGVIILTGVLTGNINVIFPTGGKWIVVNSTTGAFSITCKTAAGSGIVVTQGKARMLHGDGTNVADSRTDYKDVALTGAPTAPTAAAGDSSTTIATTAFVQGAASDAGFLAAIMFGG
jgi:hypothetical protein